MCGNVSEWPVEKISNVDLTDFVYEKVLIISCEIMPRVIHIERFSKMNVLLSLPARILNMMRVVCFVKQNIFGFLKHK